ncbi:MAG: DedA family protein [Actinomycetota bacterium]
MERRPVPQSRRMLWLILTPIAVLTLAGWLADIFAAALIDERPLLQMFLNPRNRYLVLASPQVDAVPFFVVGFIRLVLTDPLFYLLGYLYGDAALRWMERKMGEDRDTGSIAMIERFFAKASYVIVVLMPNGYVCLLAGATGMRPRVFLPLNVIGTIGRLIVIRIAGDVFEEQLESVLDFITEYRWWLVLLSFVGVSFYAWRGRRKGALEFESVSEMERELEAEIVAEEERP